MSETWGWDDFTGDWLADMDTSVSAPFDTSSWVDEIPSAPLLVPTEEPLTDPALTPSEITDILVDPSPDGPGTLYSEPYVGEQVWNSGTGEWDTVTGVPEP